VLVIEAKQKSGALITANWARKQNKKVFAVPGPVYSSNSKGCHWLIKRGAKLTESAEDILKELGVQANLETKESQGETEEENLILNALKEEALYIDKIIERTKLTPQKVASTLSILEINKKVKNLGGSVYAISNS